MNQKDFRRIEVNSFLGLSNLPPFSFNVNNFKKNLKNFEQGVLFSITLLTFVLSLGMGTQVQAAPGSSQDFNGDGQADIVWRNSTTGATAVWLMNPSGLQEHATFPGGAGREWAIQGEGDVNEDGIADFVWRNTRIGATAIWLMNASGLREHTTFPGGAGRDWTLQGVGDVNGDTIADLIWQNNLSGATATWLMNASGLRDSATFPGGAGLEWGIRGVGDMDGDAIADFVWRNMSSGATGIWLMNASGLRDGATFPGGAGLEWGIRGVGDMDGDGIADLVWRNMSSGATAIWLMNASGLRDSATFPGGAELHWVIQGIRDVNGDGIADVVWRHRETGATATWLMNIGGTRQSSTFPGGAGAEWEIQQPFGIFVNQIRLSEEEIRAIEQTYQVRLLRGWFWYDRISGLWGYQGGPTLGVIAAELNFGGTLLPNASNGDTGIFINGREIHQLELEYLQQILGPIDPGRYFLHANGDAGLEGGPVLINLLSFPERENSLGGSWIQSTAGGTLSGDGNCIGFVSGNIGQLWGC